MDWALIKQSYTVKGAALTIMGAGLVYLSGQVDWRGAALLALTGIYQIIQRTWRINIQVKKDAVVLPEFPANQDNGPPAGVR